jgi:hypothetical protein
VIDRPARDKAIEVLKLFEQGQITNLEKFDPQWPHSEDAAVGMIGGAISGAYLKAELEPIEDDDRQLIERMIVFLRSSREYTEPTPHASRRRRILYAGLAAVCALMGIYFYRVQVVWPALLLPMVVGYWLVRRVQDWEWDQLRLSGEYEEGYWPFLNSKDYRAEKERQTTPQE